jgi:hypothetical protein
MGIYAAETSVSTEKSRAEIERTLKRWGATQFVYGWDDETALVGFAMRGRQLRFLITMPDLEDKHFKWTGHKPPRRRTVNQQAEAHEQAVRQRWRALHLVIKAKLEAVESGISTFDTEFLAQLVLPNGQTVGQAVVPRIVAGIEANEMPSLLADFTGPAAIES